MAKPNLGPCAGGLLKFKQIVGKALKYEALRAYKSLKARGTVLMVFSDTCYIKSKQPVVSSMRYCACAALKKKTLKLKHVLRRKLSVSLTFNSSRNAFG